MSRQLVIPGRVALQQSPLALHQPETIMPKQEVMVKQKIEQRVNSKPPL